MLHIFLLPLEFCLERTLMIRYRTNQIHGPINLSSQDLSRVPRGREMTLCLGTSSHLSDCDQVSSVVNKVQTRRCPVPRQHVHILNIFCHACRVTYIIAVQRAPHCRPQLVPCPAWSRAVICKYKVDWIRFLRFAVCPWTLRDLILDTNKKQTIFVDTWPRKSSMIIIWINVSGEGCCKRKKDFKLELCRVVVTNELWSLDGWKRKRKNTQLFRRLWRIKALEILWTDNNRTPKLKWENFEKKLETNQFYRLVTFCPILFKLP